MGDTGEWAGGPNDQSRRRNKIENLLHAADWAFSDVAPDRLKSEIKDVDDAAGVWKWNARSLKLDYTDPKTDAEAFALPQWGPLLHHLRSLGLPIQRVRSLVRGGRDGVRFENLCVCDADEDGKVIPYRIWVLPNVERMPDLVCDYRSSRGEVPDEVAWCASTEAFVKASGATEDKPLIKEGRLTKNPLGRALAGKVNGFLDNSVRVTVWAKDAPTAQAVVEEAKTDRYRRRVVWMARGDLFIYATPSLIEGAQGKNETEHLFVHKLVALQRKYAELSRA